MNINMKKTVLFLLAIMVVSFIAAGSIMSVQGVKGILFNKVGVTGQQDINEEKFFKVNGIKDIEVNTVSTAIKIIPVDSDEIKVHYYGYANNSANRPAPELIAEQRGSGLFVQVKHRVNLNIGFNFSNERLNLDIYVPKNFNGSIDTNTVSGSTNIDGLALGKLKSNSVSGSINGKSVSAKDLTVGTTSGSIRLTGFAGKLEAHTVSGSVNVEYTEVKDDAKISTVSGSANVKLPNNTGFILDFSTVSGSFNSAFPITTQGSVGKRNVNGTVGNGGAKFTVNTTSGSLNINK